VPVAVDEGSVHDIPGVRIVRDKGFIGILAEHEWDAVQAAERLTVTWSEAPPPFPAMEALYDHIRAAPVVKREVPVATGEIDPALSGAACRSGIRVAVPIACQHGSRLRRRRREGRRCDIVDRLTETPFRPRRGRSDAGSTAREGAWDLDTGPGL